jgi:Domain of unknown function (DUF4340)
MNLKTTIVLALLVGAGTGAWFWLDHNKPPEAAVSPTKKFLETDLAADKITRVEVSREMKPLAPPLHYSSIIGSLGSPHGIVFGTAAFSKKIPTTLFILERPGTEWRLPGNWRVRTQEAKEWTTVLTTLRTRFAPIALAKDADLKPYGLDEHPLTIKVTVGEKTRILHFGEEPEGENKFTRSTFVRLEDEPEIIRLGPGILSALARKAEYFQQRRLFSVDRTATQAGGKVEGDRVAADLIEVETKTAKYTIIKKDKEWILREAQKKDGKNWVHAASEDRLDPVKSDALLRGFTDFWAERLVDNKSLEESGLNDPEFIVSVREPNNQPIRLWIGKVSESKTSFETKPGPPGMPPKFIKEEYRYAKLEGNNQIFEIKTDKLADVTVALAELRDPTLARFNPDDVKRLEMRHGDQDMVLVKVMDNDKEKWRFEKPGKEDADAKMVEDVLEKLASLQARDADILDEIDAKAVGLDKPQGRVKVTLEEADKDAKKKDDKDAAKKKREIVFQLGMKEKDNDKLYVKVDAWPRVNQINGDLWKLVTRSDLAYRPRDLWRLGRDEITRITIHADTASYHLDRADRVWKIGGPIEAEAMGAVVDQIAGELGNLKAERFEADAKDLTKFGLDKPAFKIEVASKDGKPRSLQIGKSTDGGRFAKLGDSDAVFVLHEKLAGAFTKDPFNLIEKNFLTLNPEAIERIRFQHSTAPFTLASKNDRWQVLDSPAPAFNVDGEMIKGALSTWGLLRADKIVAVGPKIDWAKFGLDKPASTVTVSLKATEKSKAGEHVIEVGKEAEGGGRYVRVDKKDLVAVFDAYAIEDLQPSYLEFMDTRVLRFDGDAVTIIERKMKDADLELTRREDLWVITKPGARDADLLTINDILRNTSALRAKRIAAYSAKDLAPFGLDKPAAMVTLLLETPDGATSKHVLKLGNLASDKVKRDTDERFAMIDNQPTVVVLTAELSRHLMAPALYFADRNLAAFSSVDRVELTRGLRKAVFTRTNAGWKMTEPADALAEDAVIEDLIASMQRLRADEIVADKTTDPKKFGLDQPFLQWRLKSGDTERLHLVVGALENDKPGARRYAKLGDKNQVFLLSAKVAAKVQGEPRDRRIWPSFALPSKMSIVHGDKSFTLVQKGTEWQVEGAPDKKLDSKLIDDTLRAFDSLKAIQWIVDAKADLKPFGLVEPAWKITLDGPKDTRVLWLGGHEDKTKRFFATVPGSGAVFVLDEAISARISRNLEAYLAAEKKK